MTTCNDDDDSNYNYDNVTLIISNPLPRKPVARNSRASRRGGVDCRACIVIIVR